MASSFLRHAVVYGFGNILIYAAGFLLLPLYVRCLSPAEYALLDIFQRCGEILTLCLLYNGLRQALFAFHNQTDDTQEKRAAVGNTLFLAAILLGIGGALLMIFAHSIGTALGIGHVQLFRFAILTFLCETLAILLIALAQARVQSGLFVVMTVVQFAIRVSLCILFVACWSWGAQGVLTASLLASLTVIAILLAREIKVGLALNPAQFRAMLWFALPFVPGGIGFFILNSGDRFFLLRHVTWVEIGAYALGYKLALVVKLLSRRPLYQVWSAKMYKAAESPDASKLFGRVFSRIIGAYVLVGAGLCLVDREVVLLLTGWDYNGAASVIVPVVLGYLFLSASDLMDAAFYIKRKTAWKTPITCFATLIMLALYATLIPAFGIFGAAWATAIGFSTHTVMTWYCSQKVMRVEYQWKRVLCFLGLAIAIWIGSRLLPVSLWMIPVKFLLWTVLPLSAWQVGLVTPDEKESLLSFWRSMIHRSRPSSNALATSPQ